MTIEQRNPDAGQNAGSYRPQKEHRMMSASLSARSNRLELLWLAAVATA
jgi:hypothetical protein